MFRTTVEDISDEEFETRTATEMLAQFCEKDCDYNKIKDILEKEYCLKVINETPIEVEELRTE